MSGLGELEEEPKAIFWQKSKMTANEFALISMVTLREGQLKKLKKCVSDVKNSMRDEDLACITETFQLIHQVRETTYDLIEGTQKWQQGFTKNIRPQLMSVDYLVELIDCMQFFGSSSLRRLFTFNTQIPGNIFLLPHPVLAASKPPNRCDKELVKAIQNFAEPDELRMLGCMKILQNSLPPSEFSRIMPLPHWMNNKWVPHIVGCKKEKAEEWYKVGDGLGAGIVKQSNFLRRKKTDKNGNVVADDVAAGAVGEGGADGKPTSAGGAGTGSLNGASVESLGGLDASTSMVQSVVLESRPASPDKRAQSAEGSESPIKRGRIPKDKVKNYGPTVDPATGRINTAALIASQGFSEKIPSSFGASMPIRRNFTKEVNYMSKKNNKFSMEKLFNWDDLDDDLPKEKKVDGIAAAMALKAERENKYKGFEEQEQERIKAELDKLKASKGLGAMRPPSPPKTVEERNDRLIACGLSTMMLSDSFKAASGLPPNNKTLGEKKRAEKILADMEKNKNNPW